MRMTEEYTIPLAKIIKELGLRAMHLPQNAEEILIRSRDVIRPGLELYGFCDYFDPHRITVLGRSEMAMLQSLGEEKKATAIEHFFALRPATVIVARDITPSERMLAAAEKNDIPLLSSKDSTSNVVADLVSLLNVELAQQGEAIQQRRRAYLETLAPLACSNYEELSHGAETLRLRYAAQFEPGGLAQLLRQKMPEELRAGQSLCGPHREDLELLLDGQPAKVYASQGQQRSVVLSLKMAEAAAAASITGEHPVLLLDDVLSELDDGRKQYLLTRMREKQTFVTSCDDTAFLRTDGEVYRMNGGVLTKV